MRITFVSADIDNSGGFRVVAALAEELLQNGHDVRIVAPSHPRPRLKARVKAWLTGVAPVRSGLQSDHIKRFSGRTHVVEHVAPLTEHDLPDADVIIATWWETMNWVTALPSVKGIPVHLVQDYEVWAGDPAGVDAVLRIPGPKIAISSYLDALLRRDFRQNDVLLLPNAVDHDLFFAPPRSKAPSTTVGFTYSPDPRKGSDLIVKALTRARQTLPDLKVVAFGHRSPDASMPLPEWIAFHTAPPQDMLRAIYAGCDAWLFASRNEGFGLPILEAMACRTPVIGMDAGAAADLIDAASGFLLDNGDWMAMSEAIMQIARLSEREWRAASDQVHVRADQQRWTAVGNRLETALKALCARSDRSMYAHDIKSTGEAIAVSPNFGAFRSSQTSM